MSQKHPFPTQKMPLRGWSKVAMTALLLSLPPLAHGQNYWVGADGLGGDGSWAAGSFTPGLPGTQSHVYFDGAQPSGSPAATVTIGDGVYARARSLTLQNNKQVTVELGENAIFNIGEGYSSNNIVNIGGLPGGLPGPSTTRLHIKGPATGSATANISRLYLEGNDLNVGTAHTKSVELSGEGLTVTLFSKFTALAGQASLVISGGATVLTDPDGPKDDSNGPGAFYIRTGKSGALYQNHLRILDGSLAAYSIRAEGLLQLGADGVLSTSSAASTGPLNIVVRRLNTTSPGGRFEAEGSGLAADVITDVQATGTFAVGLSAPATGARSGPAEFTLSSTLKFQSESVLELGLFATGGDQLIIADGGLLQNIGTGAQLRLTLHDGYLPTAGTSWQLFSLLPGGTGAITGAFDLSAVDTDLWDLSAFNTEGGWTLSVHPIPEPGTVALLLGSTLALGGWRLRRRRIG